MLIFFYAKAYIAVALTLASVFFLLSHDMTQYIGQLRVHGPASQSAKQAAGCLCGQKCGFRCEARLQTWKKSVGGFHSWWNTAIGVFTFLLIKLMCPDGKNCLGAASVAAVAVATGLLKHVENFIQKVRCDLTKFDTDVRNSANIVDTHPRQVSKMSADSASAAKDMLSFLTEEHARYTSLGVLLACAENGFSAAFYSIGYCHQHILSPFVAKLNRCLEVELKHFEELAKEAIDEATLLFKFVRQSVEGVESAMHSLAKRHADPSDHASILETIRKDLRKLDCMICDIAGVIEKYGPQILRSPKTGITALMDELERLEVAGLHEFERVFPEERASPNGGCSWCSGHRYELLKSSGSRTLSRTVGSV